MLQRAVQFLNAGDHQHAILELRSTLEKYPSSAAYVHSLLGFEYLVTDQFVDAVECFEQAVQMLPHDPANRINFALSLAAARDFDAAEQQARRARDLDPANPLPERLLAAIARDREAQGSSK